MTENKKCYSRFVFLCWLVYSCSYLGKLSYNANINPVMEDFSVDHAAAGLVSTFFFFAYGIGQIINGLLCKKYNIKYVVFISLTCCSLANFLVGITNSFTIIKYVWLINGFAISILWPTLIRLLSEVLPKSRIRGAAVIMGTTVGIGTLVIYGVSALLVALSFYKLSFYIPAAILLAVSLFWLFSFDKFTSACKSEEDEETESSVSPDTQDKARPKKMEKAVLVSIVILAFFAVCTNLTKDGLVTWVPSILKENYELDSSFSIILTLFLPMIAVFGNYLATRVYQKIPSFVILCGVFFAAAAIFTAIVISVLSVNALVVSIICFTLVNLFVSSCNSIITGIFPLYMKGKLNSGMISGILNGFCYLGSTISSYGLGLIADNAGWSSVFYLLLAVSVSVVIVAAIYGITILVIKKKNGEVKAENN